MIAEAPDAEPVFIYYRLFLNEEGPLRSRHPIYTNNPYIGLVDATVISPPHTVSALVRSICSEESKEGGIHWDKDVDFSTELFKTLSSLEPYSLGDSISLLGEDRPGSNPQNPVILKISIKGEINIIQKVFAMLGNLF